MMTLETFRDSLNLPQPPTALSKYLNVLWYDGRNDWEAAHNIAQDIDNADGAWLHAYLHRKEGDFANAGYWYRRAGKAMPTVSIHQEWEEIVTDFLNR